MIETELNDRVRDAIIRCADETLGAGKGRTASLLLGRDPVFASIQSPKNIPRSR